MCRCLRSASPTLGRKLLPISSDYRKQQFVCRHFRSIRIADVGNKLRVLRALKRDARSPFIFVSERGAPFSVSGLQKLVERAGIAAKMPFKVHPYMLRHATGYALANRGTDTRTLQAYLGHRSIQSTVRYTELAPGRFKNLWR